MAKYSVELTDANFSDLVLKSDKPVLVDFWAQWCGPCLQIAPSLEEIAQEFEGKAVVGKVDIDVNSAVANEYGIRSIPTLMVFKNGQIVEKHIGAAPKAVLKKKLETAL